jgi:hypothetical protein
MRHFPFDARTAHEATDGPGHSWNSYGTVGFGDGDPVTFDEERGQVFVKVTLHPSFRQVYARIGSSVAGNGEAEYFPFIENDEVLVEHVGGSERDSVITHRLNNAIDKFPMTSVAGQDPKLNNFAFKRRRTPAIEEFAGPITWRSALTGAFIQIAVDGSITLKDAENAAIQISPDAFQVQGPQTADTPPEFLFQIDFTGRHGVLQIGDAIFTMSASDASPEQSTLVIPGVFTISTAANPPLEHVLTTEAFFSLLFAVGTALSTILIPIPTVTAQAVGAAILTLLTANSDKLIAALPIAQTTPISPAVSAGIQAAFATATQKPNTPTGQLLPGIGSPGLLIG